MRNVIGIVKLVVRVWRYGGVCDLLVEYIRNIVDIVLVNFIYSIFCLWEFSIIWVFLKSFLKSEIDINIIDKSSRFIKLMMKMIV